MFTDDMGKYRKNSGRVRLSSEIGAYRQPPYGVTRCTDDIAPCRRSMKCSDDIAPFQGKSLSPLVWVSMFAGSFSLTGLVVFFLLLA